MATKYRDFGGRDDQQVATVIERGRRWIAVIGIDTYKRWQRLDNAVNDANGALAAFGALGFEPVKPPLLNEAATADAIRRLVSDDLSKLAADDSLVIFFAGHGETRKKQTKVGYIIPVDGDPATGSDATWIRLSAWLTDIAQLPPRHILVVLDACHSGIALGGLLKFRGGPRSTGQKLSALYARQSRRVITSAMDDQRALDSGPLPNHSLFTGCLIEALSTGLAQSGRRFATGSQLGMYVQERVNEYDGTEQTPDVGTLELDDRGEMLFALPEVASDEPEEAVAPAPIRSWPRVTLAAIAVVCVGAGGYGIAKGCGGSPTPSSIDEGVAQTERLVDVAPSLRALVLADNPFVVVDGLAVMTRQVSRATYARYLASLADPATARPRFDADAPLSERPVAFTTQRQRAVLRCDRCTAAFDRRVEAARRRVVGHRSDGRRSTRATARVDRDLDRRRARPRRWCSGRARRCGQASDAIATAAKGARRLRVTSRSRQRSAVE